MKKYLVTSCSSLGYNLYDEEQGITIIKKKTGKLKYKNIDIFIGDYLTLDKNDEIEKVINRRNYLLRPKISNVDFICVLVSLIKPDFSSFLLDEYLTFINMQNIKAKIVFTKIDLIDNLDKYQEIASYYNKIGYDTYFIDNKLKNRDDFNKLEKDISSTKCAFVGQTGVGKSSLLNRLSPELKRKVDENDSVINRGRHTTKEVTLLEYKNGFIFDTPGFSDFEIKDLDLINLSIFFPGYNKLSQDCKFSNCIHLELTPGCNIINNVDNNFLSKTSYQNYLKLVEKVKEAKQ